MMQNRLLIVVADDFGMGPEVSRSIAELMRAGAVSGTVLLSNSPYVEADLCSWRQSGAAGEMGWHPNLNLDGPVAPPGDVRSLLTGQGNLAPLGKLLARMARGRVVYRDVVRELDAQLRRFVELVGRPPRLINGHKHIHVFPMVSHALTEVLSRHGLRPYVRRVVEPVSCLRTIPGARIKRLFLSTLGKYAARRQDRAAFPGNEWLAGITDPKWVDDSEFFTRWIAQIAKASGQVVELAVHPGYRDETLIGRDCSATDGQIERRVAEHGLLSHPSFHDACRAAGFRIATTDDFALIHGVRERFHAAA